VAEQAILENISEGSQQTGERDDRHLMKFKGKCQVLPLGRNNPRHLCHMRRD